MSKSLRDQLIKSGAAEPKKGGARTKKPKAPKAAKKDRAHGSMTARDESPDLAEQKRQAQVERDRELNRAQREELARRETIAQIRQLIDRHRIDTKDGDGERDYNFSDGGIVKRLGMSDKLYDQVVRGVVAIARLNDAYHLIPRPIADKIHEREASTIVVANDTDTANQTDADDEYANYEIPDDLMW